MEKNFYPKHFLSNVSAPTKKLNLHYLIIIIPLILVLVITGFFITSIHGSSNDNIGANSSSSDLTESSFVSDSSKSSNSSSYPAIQTVSQKSSVSSNSSVLGIENNSICTDIMRQVDKISSLQSSYIPANLVLLTTLKTDKQIQVRSEIIADLTLLFQDAKKNGIILQSVSGYRSYQTQVQLFNSYVSNEKANGLSEEEAISKANTYSAKAGHSEHQLGTVVDVSLINSSDPFNLTNSENLKLFNYLEANVKKFNFRISYPKDNNLGYQYEPWHLRWVSDCK